MDEPHTGIESSLGDAAHDADSGDPYNHLQ